MHFISKFCLKIYVQDQKTASLAHVFGKWTAIVKEFRQVINEFPNSFLLMEQDEADRNLSNRKKDFLSYKGNLMWNKKPLVYKMLGKY